MAALRPIDHSYSTAAILLSLKIFLEGPSSLRGCSSILGLMLDQLPMFRACPAANTIQSWLLRVGLYELQRPKPQAADWFVIGDHTIQLGNRKCFLVVAIRLSEWNQLETPLSLENLTMVLLEPVDKSTGPIVAKQLQRASDSLGGIRGFLSDQGTDLVHGCRQFQEKSASTQVFQDIAHVTANVLKGELLAEPDWNRFVTECGLTQPKVKQTKLGHLAPPALKIKGRYLNLGPLIDWAARMLKLLDLPQDRRPAEIPADCLDEKFGWVRGYRSSILKWQQLDQIKERVLEYCRVAGYHCGAKSELEKILKSVPPSESADRMKARLLKTVEEQSAQLNEHESVPASSEIIESLIGKGKRMQGQHSRGGFTKMILAMAASVKQLTADRITTALNTVGDSDLTAWCKAQFGRTLPSLRREALPPLAGTKIG